MWEGEGERLQKIFDIYILNIFMHWPKKFPTREMLPKNIHGARNDI